MERAPEFRSDPIPLTEFAKTIQRTTGIPVLIDWQAWLMRVLNQVQLPTSADFKGHRLERY